MQIQKQKTEAVSLCDIPHHQDLSARVWIQVWAGLSWHEDNAAGMNFARNHVFTVLHGKID